MLWVIGGPEGGPESGPSSGGPTADLGEAASSRVVIASRTLAKQSQLPS